MPLRVLLILTLLATCALPAAAIGVDSLPAPVRDALARSGGNRDELLKAYDLLPVERHAELNFLIANMPERDLTALTGRFLADTVEVACEARADMPWGGGVPEAIFFNDVLPYANLNEWRDDWRRRFFDEFRPLVEGCKTSGEAAVALNTKLFDEVGVVYSKGRPKADQSPLESIAAGKASCTGLSILLVDACRALGIPARIAGTPLWSDHSGNHTWVEVWDQGWHCLGAAESDALDKAWFTGKASRQDGSDPEQVIYAASFARTGLHFPLVWDRSLTYVPAVDVTGHYAPAVAGTLSLEDILALLGAAPLAQLLDDPRVASAGIGAGDIAAVRQVLWNKYAAEILGDTRRQDEVKGQQVTYGGKTMRYVAVRIGEKPAGGWPLYIAMHGGGGAPAQVNDSQWQQMQVYYRDSVKAGIYLAPRGVNDEWNLHWVDESFTCYDRIIENLIVFEGVDPNRVYLMGYSAGGDGAYQIPARAPDRWAAVAMSAGHPNGVPLANLADVPFLIQVGALDAAYDRNTVAAQYGVLLDGLARQFPGCYRHDCFIHAGRGHNFMDHDATGAPQAVYANPSEWLQKGDAATTHGVDTNSVHWLDQFTRAPLPREVVWDCGTTVDRSGAKMPGFWPTAGRGKSDYWIGLQGYTGEAPLEAGRIVAECEPSANAVTFTEIGNHAEILLHEKRFDLTRPVSVTVQGRRIERMPQPRLATMIRTLLDRGDPDYVFPAALSLTKNPEGDWLLEPEGAEGD